MVAEHARVDGVHLLELAHVHQEHAAAQHVLQAGAGGLENRLHVLQALLGLLLDIVGDRAGRGIGAALAGDEDQLSKPMPGEYGPTGAGRLPARTGVVGHSRIW